MDFFARQQRVRRLSVRLVLLFVVAVVAIVLAVDLAVVFAFNAWDQSGGSLAALLVMTSAATLGAIGLAALFRTVRLRGGGGVVARELGGVLVPQDTTDPQLRRLRNVVEEIAIASGVTVPEVYVLPHEQAINAFAAGWSTADAAVAVTGGALARLNRDELQGVIAHEFSHVVNGDMRLNIRLIGLLFGILFLTVIGRTMLRAGFFSGGRNNRSSGNNPLPIVGIVLLVVGFIGVVAGRIIKASVSRQREYLADASAVQFTRQTSGLVGALKKIGGLSEGSKMANPRTEEVGHMLFGPGLSLSSLFATHPPLPDRIKALDPTFNPAELGELSRRWAQSPPSGLDEDTALGLTGGPASAARPQGARGTGATVARDATLPRDASVPRDADGAMATESVLSQVGAASAAAYERAGAILERFPDELLARARRGDSAPPLVLGLLLSGHAEARQAQLAVLAERYGQPLADAAAAEAQVLTGLDPLLRLPLAEVSFPALRQLPDPQRTSVLDAVFTLVHADGRISVYEYCLSRLLYRELHEAMQPRSRWREDHGRLSRTGPAAATLLAVLAHEGNTDPEAARAAFRAGADRIFPGQQVSYAPPEQGVLALEAAWSTLDGLAPPDKAQLVRGAVDVIGHDRVLTVTEMELVRTICGLLHCPLPPMTGPAGA